jgi:predicted dehydrogenase
MKKRIVLVGCGNIGSRHLQALVKLPFSVNIDVIEPSEKSRQNALSRLREINYNSQKYNIFWHTNLDKIEKKSDLVIIATTSNGRVKIIKKLLKMKNSKFIVEKIVCQSLSEYDSLLKHMKKFHAMGWINTNMRYFKSYKKIRKYFSNSKIIHMSLTSSGNYGLGTNAIHYLDCFCWFINDYNITLSGNGLFNKLFPNKRSKDMIEFAGSISATSKNGSSITVTLIPNADLPLLVNIYGDNNKHLIINEVEEKVFNILNTKPKFDYNYEHTSTLTTKIVTDIINNNNCDLTTIENSYYIHKELFRIFCKHIKKITHKQTKICPIT